MKMNPKPHIHWDKLLQKWVIYTSDIQFQEVWTLMALEHCDKLNKE